MLNPLRTLPLVHIPKANIYAFGAPSTSGSSPVLRDVDWTVQEGEAWAIVGRMKSAIFQALMGQMRITPPPPPPGGLLPLFSTPESSKSSLQIPQSSNDKPVIDPYSRLGIVSFSHKRSPGGAFYDYTARYGAVRDEDRITLRQSMFPGSIVDVPDPFRELDRVNAVNQVKTKLQNPREEIGQNLSPQDLNLFHHLTDALKLDPLLDLPLVALSNGQMRRARIVKALLRRPELLLLDEPLTGLDTTSRPLLLDLLYKLHLKRAPRVVLGLRSQDEIPSWISHVLRVEDGTANVHSRSGQKEFDLSWRSTSSSKIHDAGVNEKVVEDVGEVVVDMKGVSVKYGPRTVLNDIHWKIRQGERWHLQGTNGSGKTTLLSLLTGDHPQSYTQAHLHLPSPTISQSSTQSVTTKPRKSIATAHLRTQIGIVSPELFDAFPRRHPGMTVWEAVCTGFDGGFVPRSLGSIEDLHNGYDPKMIEHLRVQRCWSVLEGLGPSAWSKCDNTHEAREVAASFARRRFTDLSVGEQRMVLLMRALVGRPPLVLLDEVWSGMDEEMVKAAHAYLRGAKMPWSGEHSEKNSLVNLESGLSNKQAVVVITHWEDEVPWREEDGVRRFRLEDGIGRVVS